MPAVGARARASGLVFGDPKVSKAPSATAKMQTEPSHGSTPTRLPSVEKLESTTAFVAARD